MKALIYIYAFLLANAVLGQDGKVLLSIEPSSAEVGETVLIKIKSQVEGDIEIDNLPSCFVYGYQTMQGMESEMDTYSGDLITYYYFHQTGTFGKEGTYTVGPVYVKRGHKTYKSNTVTVNIGQKAPMASGDVTDQQLRDPAFGLIQTNKTTIYEGEPLLLSAKVYARFNPTYLDNYQPYSMKGAIDKHGIGNNTNPQTRREQFKGIELYSFDYDKNIIFPVGTGDFTINGFTMKLYQGYQNFQVKSNDIEITIKPLPSDPPANFIGGVGSFDIDRELDGLNMDQGDVFKMKITISGYGNLQNITEPKPVLPKGFVIYGDPVIEENFNYTNNGAEGSISYEYNIQVSKYGTLEVPPTSISYFDLQEENYVSVATEKQTIKVKENKNFVAQEDAENAEESIEELNILDDLRKPEIVTYSDSIAGTPYFWGGVSLPVLAALLFVFISRKKELSEDEAEKQKLKRRNMDAFDEGYGALKVHMASNDRNAFYSNAELVLLKSIQLYLQENEIEAQGRQAILQELIKSPKSNLSGRVEKILSKCDEARFALVEDHSSLENTFDELQSLLKEIKQS